MSRLAEGCRAFFQAYHRDDLESFDLAMNVHDHSLRAAKRQLRWTPARAAHVGSNCVSTCGKLKSTISVLVEIEMALRKRRRMS